MNRRWWLVVAILVAVGVVLALWGRRVPAGEAASASLRALPVPDAGGFARATDPNAMSFPDAFGPHPDYQTEWWYYTGNVQAADGRPFGYQFTIFRRSLLADGPPRTSDFATQSLYMAHFALTDVAVEDFYATERFERGAGGVAGAQAQPYAVWLDDWAVTEQPDGSYQMRARTDEVAIDFTLRALKPPVRHGDNGLSAKSGEAGNASYYYSQTRLETSGTITVKGEAFAVNGLSWKDHEYGTSALGEDAVGWDWFSLQLSDGRDLMYFNIRTTAGGLDPASSGSLIAADSSVRPLAADDVRIEVLGEWQSPASGATYPSGWRLTIPAEGIDLTLTPLIPNQELDVSTIYWEGAVRIEGQANGQTVSGNGYIELTGYGAQGVPEI